MKRNIACECHETFIKKRYLHIKSKREKGELCSTIRGNAGSFIFKCLKAIYQFQNTTFAQLTSRKQSRNDFLCSEIKTENTELERYEIIFI